jgi:hypothetical protein
MMILKNSKKATGKKRLMNKSMWSNGLKIGTTKMLMTNSQNNLDKKSKYNNEYNI